MTTNESTTRTLKDYTKHDEGCRALACVYNEWIAVCGWHAAALVHVVKEGHQFQPGECSCGLDALLASPVVRSDVEAVKEARQRHVNAVHAVVEAVLDASEQDIAPLWAAVNRTCDELQLTVQQSCVGHQEEQK